MLGICIYKLIAHTVEKFITKYLWSVINPLSFWLVIKVSSWPVRTAAINIEIDDRNIIPNVAMSLNINWMSSQNYHILQEEGRPWSLIL